MLRNWPIRTKLLVSLLGPLLVLAVLALVGIRQNQAESDRAERSTAFARLAAGLAPLVHELQAERSLSISYLDSGRRRWGPQLATQRRAVDREAAIYRANAERLSADDELLAERIEYGLSELGRIGEQRQAIDGATIKTEDLAVGPTIELHEEEGEEDLEAATEEGHGPLDTPDRALDQYTDTISDLLDINGEIAPRSNNAELLKGVAASVALARAKDFADSQRSLLENVYAADHFQGEEYARLSALVAAETVYTAQFEANATEAQHELFEETVAGPGVEDVDRLIQRALDAKSQDAPKLGVKPELWFEAMSVKLDRMRVVEERLSADVIATSTAIKEGADRRAWLYSLLLAAALALAVALALLTARSLIRPMRKLEAAAEDTAERRLPGVVQRLQDGEQVDLAAESAPPIEVRSSDEIGHLAEAFNSVHRVAVRVAGREAALRRSVGDMFLNLARRSQSLIERQLEVIDELEVSASEAEVRAGLGELDHLATRMRRNAENLIILSGSEPARRWRSPIGLTEVVQASVEEVKEHTRVELLPLDRVELAGHAAADVMHLLAELIENAVTFSAPGTKALVAGQPLPSGYLLEIEDQGLGMTDEQLVKVNQRLAKPPDIDLALAKMLGFFVVTQLAAKHGIKVQLRHSWYGGITALVLLPRQLLVTPTELAPVADRPPADVREPSTDPDLAWIDGRVPMVHVPLRRPGG
ncbi:MAG TPA: nitrate- and nitrite sensing domain-containing protein [Actinomycetota bacterium]|jgi:HAMP domain-containing protein|nr:nitrate- and nitrite sensing domain-containing protein [Actinomycetota bacterium]